MSLETDIQKDLRTFILTDVTGVGVYDKHAEEVDFTPYVTFGPTQRVANHSKEHRASIYHVTLDLWVRDAKGSGTARDLAAAIVDAVDFKKLPTAELDCYFEDSISLYEDDGVTTHIAITLQVR